jgi:LacI family transcriptional regulator, repressor for deo operon, udp, cdd, tsx, nupC, and nupG
MNSNSEVEQTKAQGETGERRSLDKLVYSSNKTITMAAIAKTAGVSQGAISSMLNDRDYGIRVSEKTRERVFKACRELGYIPNDLRAVVRMYPELGDLCVLVSHDAAALVNNPFYARILKGIIGALTTPMRNVTLAEYDDHANYEATPELLPAPIRSGVASKFICIGGANLSLFHTLLKRNSPVAFLGHGVSLRGLTTIQPDYTSASNLAVQHLIAAGHKKIAVVSGSFGSPDHSIIELNRGVRQAGENAGITFDAHNIFYGNLDTKSGTDALAALVDRKQTPTAVFCLSDEAAAGVLMHANSVGIKVPSQLSIIGCSDTACSETLSLSTIHFPAEEIGAAAVQDVESRVSEDDFPNSKNIVLPVRLIERKSTAPAPAP